MFRLIYGKINHLKISNSLPQSLLLRPVLFNTRDSGTVYMSPVKPASTIYEILPSTAKGDLN